MRMLRSIFVCGVIGAAFAIPTERPAEANGGGIGVDTGGGPTFYTYATSFSVPPYNTPCGNPMPKGTVKLRTTYLNPEGKQTTFKAVATMGDGPSVTKELNFSNKTTTDWEASYSPSDIGAVHSFAVMVGVNGANPGDNVGQMHIGCSVTSQATVASGPAGDSTVSTNCTGYAPSKLTLVDTGGGQWGVMTAPQIKDQPQIISSLYIGSRKEDAVAIDDMLHHGNNLCSIGISSADAIWVFNGQGDSNKPVNWPGTCTAYDPKTVQISNDAKGWWAKSGTHVFGVYGLEADARAVAEAATRGRAQDCRAFEGVEPKIHVFHYFH